MFFDFQEVSALCVKHRAFFFSYLKQKYSSPWSKTSLDFLDHLVVAFVPGSVTAGLCCLASAFPFGLDIEKQNIILN